MVPDVSNQAVWSLPENGMHDADVAQQLLSIVERQSRVGLIVATADGIVRHWGPALEGALGYTEAEALGRPIPCSNTHERDCLDEALRSVMSGAIWRPGIIRQSRRDGSLADLRIVAHPLRNAQGNVVAAAILVEDVTDNQRYRELNRRLTEVLSAVRGFGDLDDILRMVRDVIIELGGFDRAGVFQVIGDEVRGAWGTDRDGRPQRESDLRETLADWGPTIGDLAAGTVPFVIEKWIPYRQDDNMARPIDHVVIPMRAGEELVGLISADNLISGRPVTEADVLPLVPFAEEAAVAIRATRLLQQVQSHAGELEREVAARTAELERAVADLEQFAYRVAHDLRTPLRAIDGMAHILHEEMEERRTATWPDIEPRVQRISSCARLAGRLVDDLLTLARIGRQPFRPEETDVREAAMAAWRSLEAQGKTRDVRMNMLTMPPALADRDLLVEMYVRLLDNAVKFTRNTAEPRIEVGALTDATGPHPVFYIRDNGVGFEPADAQRIFGVFARMHCPDDFEGSGIGLAIVSRIMQRHGGRVWAEGSPGRGATFYWALPPS